MTENASYVREPLQAAIEAFGENADHLKNKQSVADTLAALKVEKRLTIPTACFGILDTHYATEILTALMSERDNCLKEEWLVSEKQRELFGFMLELEVGTIKATLHLNHHSSGEWLTNRLESLEKFRNLLMEQQISGGEVVK